MRDREEIEKDASCIINDYLNTGDLGEAMLQQNQLLLETILDFREMFIEGDCQSIDEGIFDRLKLMENEQN